MTAQFTQLLLSQLIAHLLTDYTFQNDSKANDKNTKGFKSKFLKWHALIMFLTSFILSFQLEFVFGAIIIAFTHYIIDGLKPKLNKSKSMGNYAFFIDQILHLAIIVGVVFLFSKLFTIAPMTKGLELNKIFTLVVGFLLAGKASNIVIKEIFKIFKVSIPKNDNDLQNAGKLIGIVERWLTLAFILMSQYAAVGFLLASKSILRFKTQEGNEFNKTEYVLVGTLLSFAIAIGIGITFNLIYPPID
ncbi:MULTISPECIES: DUF3307 domain-containing protein [Flavobacteriaceae]|uniref:DUF3307 domain-containing protein n=1 Tax=Flavobacteriaceae TaxID=49546 RepID=UPI001491F022|nr:MULTISPECIES: DUF3307 domain-containing protein [Allomuricauda]MDC6364741.1 DUF3307 domain-containing protein [Muricauda sp. AC10]